MARKSATATMEETTVPQFVMRTVRIKINGDSLSWSKEIAAPPKKSDYQQHEEKHWRERFHDVDGEAAIPTMALKKALQEAAKGIGIPGKGKATYAQPFKAGVVPLAEYAPIGVKIADLDHEWVLVPANPANQKPGQGGRVRKCFPLVRKWSAELEFNVFDDQITEAVFHDILKGAGLMVGVGRWRPSNGGLYGRFTIESIEWSKV